MFIQKCYILKNTPELKIRLSNIGYKETIFYNGDLDYMYVNCLGKGEYGEANANAPILNNAINCGENEELFLAIAALQNGTDLYQYFICTNDETIYDEDHPKVVECRYKKGEFVYNSLCFDYSLVANRNNWRKATVEELIEHFK